MGINALSTIDRYVCIIKHHVFFNNYHEQHGVRQGAVGERERELLCP